MPSPLTPRQLEVALLIEGYMREHHGRSPTMREIATMIGVASTNAVELLLRGIENAGYLARDPKISRSIRIIAPLADATIRPGNGTPTRTRVAE